MNEGLLWKRELLPNGVRLLLYPKPSTLTAQLSVVVQYGSNDDPDQQAGAAHFLEHMVPGGSPRRIGLSREVERLGGFLDFFTNHEYTMSLADIMPNKLTQVSHLMSELFFDGCFEEEQFCSERKIIFNELAEIADDPREKVGEMIARCLFEMHPVRRPIGGSVKSVRQLTLEKLNQIYLRHYEPQNLILILTGNFSQKDVEVAVQDFSCKLAQRVTAKEKPNPEVRNPRRTFSKKKEGLSQTYLSIGARTTHSRHPDVPALDLLDVILGAGASSRLFIELREKHALMYDVGSSQIDGSDFGYFSINCALKQKHLEVAERLIMRELAKLKTEKVPNEELNKGKDMILGDILRGIDNAESCPEILAVMEIQFGNANALINYINGVKAVTADQVRDIANKYLQEENFAKAIIAPKT